MQLALAVMLLLSMLGPLFALDRAAAAEEEARWSPVTIPAEGKTGNWQLAGGSDIKHLTMASNGILYTFSNPGGTTDRLFMSSDNGSTWTPVGNITSVIVAIAVAPDDAASVYYATNSTVYKSSDGGNSFTPLPFKPGGAGTNNVEITSLAVAPLTGSRLIATGTRDNDSAQYGGVYILDESDLFHGWVDTAIGNYDAVALAFSPGFTVDRQLVAVSTNETDTRVTIRTGSSGWGQMSGDATISAIVPRGGTITFPPDYGAESGRSTWFLALDTGSNTGDVYRIDGQPAPEEALVTDLNVALMDNLANIDITGIAVSGNVSEYYLMAGTASGTQVYISADSGQNWTKSAKEPTGQSQTYLLVSPDFARSHRAYAATSGLESAFSYTEDGGRTWNQISLIDTRLDSIVDLAVSPAYSEDNTVFMLTWGGKHSLWRSFDDGDQWERVFTSTLAGTDSLTLLEISPEYGNDRRVLFLAGTFGSHWAIWKTEDSGQTFTRRTALFSIDAFTVVDDDSLFAVSYNGTNGLVYSTANSGFFYSATAVAGKQSLKSIALSPDFEKDRTILLGNSNGWIYLSSDNGTSFEPLPPNATTPSLTGNIVVAFDSGFSSNGIVYAASDTQTTMASKERLFRFVIGRSNSWESIDSTLSTGSKLNQMVVTASGALYAANSMNDGGMERSLTSTSPLNSAFETVTRGLTDNATLTGLWSRGDRLWSVDKKNVRLMIYLDSMMFPAAPAFPADMSPGIDINGARLEWKGLKGATGYQWQVSDGAGFTSIASNLDGYVDGTSVRLPALEMATTYYWRIRATEPVLSPWSEKRSFSTVLGTAIVAPELYIPEAGASGVPMKPVFQWSVFAGAERYELLLSTNASFSDPVIVKTGNNALPANAWQSDIDLDYGTTYFWKVRAISADSYSAWSAVGAFTTEAATSEETAQSLPPVSPPPSPPPPPSSPAQPPSQTPSAAPSPVSPSNQSVLPAWAIYAGIALLAAVVLLLAALVVLQIIRLR
ncbi:MAG: hypothetical protein HYX83_03305 [Chloroflexi bacterium]|nr:hypothetical protein [Chloroflexota bacterium]